MSVCTMYVYWRTELFAKWWSILIHKDNKTFNTAKPQDNKKDLENVLG